MEIVHEQWMHVAGEFENWTYDVSTHGRVRNSTSGRVLRCYRNTYEYASLYVFRDGAGIRKRVSVHRLVAEAFIGEREPGKEINHKDGNKFNNFVGNLEWVTPKENMQHAFSNGLMRRNGKQLRLKTTARKKRQCTLGSPRGERNPNSVLNAVDVKEIRTMHANGMSGRGLAKHFGIDPRTIWQVVTRKTWSHVE